MKNFPIIAVLVIVLAMVVISTPARAVTPASSIDSWVEIVAKYQGHPVAVLEKDNLVFMVIYEKSENPDMDNPLALDVRTPEGIPVFFFEYDKEKAVMVWRHPALENDWVEA